jgi:hypothetical protein
MTQKHSVGRIVMAIVAAVVVLVGTGFFAARAAVHRVEHLFDNTTAACTGLGHAAKDASRSTWTTQSVTGPQHQTEFAVSNVIDIPTGSRGMRVDAVVYGVRNAPIFPEPVGISVVPDGQLLAAITQRAERDQTPAAPTNSTSPESSLLVSIGFGNKAINENVALQPGAYRLVSAAGIARIGTVDFRICR